MITIAQDADIHFVWFGRIPRNIKDNIDTAALFHNHTREIKLWVSSSGHIQVKPSIEEIKTQFKDHKNVVIKTIEEELQVKDIAIIESILKEKYLKEQDRLKSASDFSRIAILAKHGGIYLDGDVKLKSTIPVINCEKGILLHSDSWEKNKKIFFNTDFYDVIAAPKDSPIIESTLNELRDDFNPANNPFYDAGELVKAEAIVSKFIDELPEKDLRDKVYDSKDQDEGLLISDKDCEKVKNFISNISFPKEYISCVPIGTAQSNYCDLEANKEYLTNFLEKEKLSESNSINNLEELKKTNQDTEPKQRIIEEQSETVSREEKRATLLKQLADEDKKVKEEENKIKEKYQKEVAELKEDGQKKLEKLHKEKEKSNSEKEQKERDLNKEIEKKAEKEFHLDKASKDSDFEDFDEISENLVYENLDQNIPMKLRNNNSDIEDISLQKEKDLLQKEQERQKQEEQDRQEAKVN